MIATAFMVRENRVVNCYRELYLIIFKDMDRKTPERNKLNENIS